jgi:GTP-binding protein
VSHSSTAAPLSQVAIVGRPNVGKSTLFNRIVGRREAIVGSQSGMTRDRHTAETDWNGVGFVLVDTGGIDQGTNEDLLRQVEQQVMIAVDVADLALLVVDGRDGLLPMDREIASQLWRRGVTPLVVINKCDKAESAAAVELPFHELGIELMFVISAEHGFGVADLLDTVAALLPKTALEDSDEDRTTRVAFVGRPNVGKSSLVNAMLGSERVIVSEMPGTTRDAIDTALEADGKRYVLVDTAGMRKRARIDTHAEIASVAMARRRLTHADVALLVIDATEGVTRQDLHVAAEADQMGCGLIVVVNKWDTVEDPAGLRPEVEEYVRTRLGRMRYARVAITSATKGTGVGKLLPLVDEVAATRARRVPTADLNSAFETMVGRHAPAGGTSAATPKYLTQVGVNPPRFVAFAGGRGAARGDYVRYLENRLRETFDFGGTPVFIKLRRSRRGGRTARRR